MNWDRIVKSFENTLGRSPLKVDRNQALLVADDQLLAIIRVEPGTEVLNLFLREDLPPRNAAVIAATLSATHRINIDETFNFAEDGSWVFSGDEGRDLFRKLING